MDSYLPANTALLDAYLWVKTPGQSDGQCDIAGGVRAWQDYASAGAGGGYTPSIAALADELELELDHVRSAVEPAEGQGLHRPGRWSLVPGTGAAAGAERRPQLH